LAWCYVEARSALIDFATFGPVKENPDGKVFTEIFEAMLDPRRGK
jgi:hypothetical protein